MESEDRAPDSGASGSDAMRAALEREMYWAEETSSLRRKTTAEVRDALHDFAVLMRDDERQVIPRAEPNLASRSRWRRQLKLRLFRLMRPISWRYDRLLAEQAELTASLAERLSEAEAEIAHMREVLEDRPKATEVAQVPQPFRPAVEGP